MTVFILFYFAGLLTVARGRAARIAAGAVRNIGVAVVPRCGTASVFAAVLGYICYTEGFAVRMLLITVIYCTVIRCIVIFTQFTVIVASVFITQADVTVFIIKHNTYLLCVF